jgi:hypothetical protein
MKVKYLSVLFLLFLYEFASGQVPGMPKILGKNKQPQVFTLYPVMSNLNSAVLTGQSLNNGQTNVTETGILWGTTTPTYTSSTAPNIISTKSGAGTITSTFSGLTLLETYYIRAYAVNGAGITYGDLQKYIHGTVLSPTGKVWMAYNLDAIVYPPTSMNDPNAYYSLYQWGRNADGHQIIRPTTGSGSNTIPYSEYIVSGTSDLPNLPTSYNDNIMTQTVGNKFIQVGGGDWLNPTNDLLWQEDGINSPCPSGFRLPTGTEFQDEANTWTSRDINGAYSSVLKLTYGGYRFYNASSKMSSQTLGLYWTSTVSNGIPTWFSTNDGTSKTGTLPLSNQGYGVKANGLAVRCIKK